MPEYLKLRFGGNRVTVLIAIMSLVTYIFTKISVDLYSGAIFIQQALQLENIWLPVVILLFITAIFTIGGGLTAVVYTDTLQTVIMLCGSIYVSIVAFGHIGGMQNFSEKYKKSAPTIGNQTIIDQCGKTSPDSFKVTRGIYDEDFPWPGVITGMTINSLWYWCSDQVIVQRCLAAKNQMHAKGACIFASYLKISSIFIMVMPGMISRILYPDKVGCVDNEVCQEFCGNDRCNDVAYPYLVTKILPAGAKGLLVAVMLSALLSSLTSIFNSASSIFTIDIWPKFKAHMGRERPSEKELMVVGRLFTIGLIIVSVLWIPVVQHSQTGTLFVYIQMVSSYLQPPVAAIYLLGIFVPQANETGVFWSLVSALGLGFIRMGMDMKWQRPSCEDVLLNHIDTRPAITRHFPYLYFSVFLFVYTIVTCLVISKLTRKSGTFQEPPPGTTWKSQNVDVFDDSNFGKGEHEKHRLSSQSDTLLMNVKKESGSKDSVESKKVSMFAKLCGMDAEDQTVDGLGPKNCPRSGYPMNSKGARAAGMYFDTDIPKVEKVDPFWNRIVDANAVVCLVACAALWAYYW
jgi:sodium/myo-inositol cotransporter 11